MGPEMGMIPWQAKECWCPPELCREEELLEGCVCVLPAWSQTSGLSTESECLLFYTPCSVAVGFEAHACTSLCSTQESDLSD